jgi:hypothetical protein
MRLVGLLGWLAGCSPSARLSPDAAASEPPPYRIMAATKIAADHAVRNPVTVVGTRVDGSPAFDELVLSVDRPGAGTFTEAVVTLGEIGASSVFQACDFGVPSCAGPVNLTASLASDPTTPVATVPIEIVDPLEVHPAKPCLGGGSVLYLKGNDLIFTGEMTFTNPPWTVTSTYPPAVAMDISAGGQTFSLLFDARLYSPAGHIPDRYENATHAEVRDRPRMSIHHGTPCTTITGRYEVTEFVVVASNVESFTIAFEQHCDGDPERAITGCVHYQ